MQKYFLHILIGFGVFVVALVVYEMYRLNMTFSDLYQKVSTSIPSQKESVQEDTSIDTPIDAVETGRIQDPDIKPTAPTGKIKADMFTGKLEKVDTGCFADGECYVIVDGKHVTATIGWSRDVVGSVKGVDGFGDLEKYIGKKVEVYAHVKEDGTYSLYGSEGFYIKPIEVAPQKAVVGPGCKIGGCSGQLCVNEEQGDVITTCEYKEAYACYKIASCEKQENDQCGWIESKELNACLLQAGGGAERI